MSPHPNPRNFQNQSQSQFKFFRILNLKISTAFYKIPKIFRWKSSEIGVKKHILWKQISTDISGLGENYHIGAHNRFDWNFDVNSKDLQNRSRSKNFRLRLGSKYQSLIIIIWSSYPNKESRWFFDSRGPVIIRKFRKLGKFVSGRFST